GVSREDLDLVRLYLKTVGQRKLLTAKQEQAIGKRIEDARGELQAALGSIPVALNTLLSLASEVKKGSAPAAELILLPDGGELQEENVQSVLSSFQRMRTALRRVAEARARCEDGRSTPATRATHMRAIRDAHLAIENELRKLPLRPSLVEQVVKELGDINKAFEELDKLPPAKRTEARRELEERAGLSRRQFTQAYARVREHEETVNEA